MMKFVSVSQATAHRIFMMLERQSLATGQAPSFERGVDRTTIIRWRGAIVLQMNYAADWFLARVE
jgi:hypothetical protein